MSTELTRMDRRGAPRGGFTIVELLVVIGIIAILATIGLVVANEAFRTSKRAATTNLLHSIGTALESFRNDFGDYPPLITRLADYSGPSVSAPKAIATPEVWGERARLAGGNDLAGARMAVDYEYEDARWNSDWSAAAYLLGAGDLNGDGDTDKALLDLDDGQEGFGCRHPGENFLAWTRIERVGGQQQLVHRPSEEGRVYGPYLDPGSVGKFIERVPVYYDGTTNRIEVDASGGSNQIMYRFLDPWGNPIRYYRNWRTYNPLDSNRKASVDFAPVELRSYESLNKQYEDDAGAGDIGLNTAVMRAPFMLLAAGDDPSKRTYFDGQDRAPAPFGDVVPKDNRTSAYHFQDGVDGSFDAALDPFSVLTTEAERVEFLRMIESNVRYAP